MKKLIRVEFTDGSSCEVIPAALDLFLRETDLVRCFQRENGWVWVGVTPLRGACSARNYQGVERRNSN